MTGLLRHLDENGERYLLLWLYAFIVIVIFVEVVRRFVFEFSSLWGEETARYAFVYLVWIGAARAVRDRAHLRIDVVTHYLPPRAVAALSLLCDALTIAFAVVAVYFSLAPLATSIHFGSVTDGLRIVKAWFLVAVPLGFTLITIRAIQAMIRDAMALCRGGEIAAKGKLFE